MLITEGQARATGPVRWCFGSRLWPALMAFGAALLVLFVLARSASAAIATISVPCTAGVGDTSALDAAIISADTGGGGTISLASGCAYSFTAPYANPSPAVTGTPGDLADWYGPAAMPAITAAITIQGNGATITRATGPTAFRLFFVGADPTAAATTGWTTPGAGSLTLANVTLYGGLALGGTSGGGGGGGGLGAGGAIYSQGTVVLSAVTLSGNEAQGGSAAVGGTGLGGGGIGAGASTSANDGGGFGSGFTEPASFPAGGAGGTGLLTIDGGGGGGFATSEAGAPAALLGPGAGGGSLTGTAGDAQASNGAMGGDGGGGGSSDAALTAGGAGGAYGEGGAGGASGGAGGGGVGGGGGGATNGAGGGFGGGGGYPGGEGGFGAGGAGGSGGAGFGAGAGGSSSTGGGGAGLGGAIFNQQGTLVSVNTTLSANTAAGGNGQGMGTVAGKAGQGLGGAIFSLNGAVELINDTIAANTADDGGALDLVGYDAHSALTAGATVLVNDILSGSVTGASASTHDLSVVAPSAVADATPNKATAVAVASAPNIVVSNATGPLAGALTANPLLGPLAANGGPGMATMLPGAGSPALGAGTTTGAPATDERGTARPSSGPIDLGAVQVSTTSSAPPPPTAPVPAVVTGAAASVSASAATLNATVNPEGVATSYSFQWGKTSKYGRTTAKASAGAGTSAVAVNAQLSQLLPDTTYHYRIVATNANGTSDGIGKVFTTGRGKLAGLVVSTKPSHARTFPYRYTFSGKVRLPRGVTSAAGCSGTISVRIKRAGKTLSLGRATVARACGWKLSARLGKRASVPGKGKLTVTVTFGGNGALVPFKGKSFTVLYG